MDAGDGDDDGNGNGICFPYDVLVDILRRLPGGAIAACRCVCRAWRDMVAVHELSGLERYFPRRAFPGVFVNKTGCRSRISFFTAPGSDRCLYYPRDATVEQSCNGLLLLNDWGEHHVLNPATARYARLPRPTPPCSFDFISLAFDPGVSLHYEVFLFQKGALVQEGTTEEPKKKKVVSLLVYSSCTAARWENRAFVPGLCAPGHLYDAVATPPGGCEGAFWTSEYWRGSLYVHCHNDVLMIVCPSKGTYDMVPLPEENRGPKSVISLPSSSLLSSYERGIHYVDIDRLQLRVWLLTESTNGVLGWTLAHHGNLSPHGHMIHPLAIQPRVTWGIVGSSSGPVSLTDNDYDDDDDKKDCLDGSECSWNSDEDNFVDVVGDAAHLVGPPAWGTYGRIVGFHPHKNAVILVMYFAVVVYHLDTSTMQYLGDEGEMMKDFEQQACCVDGAFTCRPCYQDVLPLAVRKSSS